MARTDSNDYTAASSLITAFLRSQDRALDHGETINLTAYLMYASYVSRNADMLYVKNLDPVFDMGAVRQRLGNDYVAAQLLDAYAELDSHAFELPRVWMETRRFHDLQKQLILWTDLIGSCGLHLEDDEAFGTARAIARALEDAFITGGRFSSEFSSYGPLGRLVSRLADVDGRGVYDPACGNGTFLAEAASEGASSLAGEDINDEAVMLARILAFFSAPERVRKIDVGDSLRTCSGSHERIVCAPPLGMRVPRDAAPVYSSAPAGDEGAIRASGTFADDYFVAKALAELTDDGVAVFQLGAGFLFHTQRARRELREKLVAGGHLRAVIELPGGCMPGSAVNTALIVLTKTPDDGDVLLLDAASKAVEGEGLFDQSRRACVPTETGIEWIADVVSRRREVPGASVLVPRDRIVQADCDLCYSTYGEVPASDSPSRPTEQILADIKKTHREIAALDARIEMILTSLR